MTDATKAAITLMALSLYVAGGNRRVRPPVSPTEKAPSPLPATAGGEP